MNACVYNDLDKWLEYPAMFKNVLRKCMETGIYFHIMDDPKVAVDKKQALKELMPAIMKQTDPQKLVKVYQKQIPRLFKTHQINCKKMHDTFVRVAPSKRVF